MRNIAVILIGFLFAAEPLFAQISDSAYIRQNYRKEEVQIPMRDGTKLFTSLYIPRDSSKTYPIILMRTPYSVGPYGAEAYRTALFPSVHEMREGYIFAAQDVRGRFMSEGTYVDVRPYRPGKKKGETDEASDTYDTVEWLLRNVRGNSGKVGITGISYPGFYTTMGIIDAHPAVVAASPQAPIADWFIGDDDHHNGALFLAETFGFFSGFGLSRPAPTTTWRPGFRMPYPDAYKFFLAMGSLANANRLYFRDSIAYWKDLMAHPNYDSFWQERSTLPHLTRVRPTVLTVGGWFDKEDLYGALNTYRAIESKNPKARNGIVMGPWSHGQWNRDGGERLGDIQFGSATGTWFREHVQFPFFQKYLKGKEIEPIAEATIFETGANVWHALDAWPPKDVTPGALYLLPNRGLGFVPSTEEGFSEYLSDPSAPVPFTARISGGVSPTYMVEDQRFADRRPDVLTFSTDRLTEGVTVAGPINAELYVSTTGSDADWVVKVIDVFPDDSVGSAASGAPLSGFEMLVRADVFRGKFRMSYTVPEPFVPGEITRVAFTLPDICHRFKQGHRIMVQIQSSWFPLVDRNPQTFVNIHEAAPGDFVPAEHRVYHSARYPSRLNVNFWRPPTGGTE